ncbi:MAG: hypothetical protein FJ387_14115 [Verrucomicrobia bacterium]|nr:hypothetical protein [Verrucomicrobiota bacterium]
MLNLTKMTTAVLTALILTVTLARGDEPKTDQAPSFAVPRMATAPTIDGAIDPAEWQGAMAVSGVADQSTDMSKPLLPRPTTFFLGWDPDHLYFACRTYLRPGYKPNVPAGRSPGLAYVWDDALELNWFPMGANVPAANKANSYKWFLNALGFIGDCSRLALGQQFKSWNPQFVIKARLTEPGSAPNGGRWWEMEMRATPQDFELEGPHRAGDQWKMLLGINHFPGWMQARIPCRGPYLDPFGFNVMTLVEQTPAVQMTMDSLNNLATDGTAALTVRAFNPAKEPVELALAVNVADAIKKNEKLTVPPGKSAEFVLDEKLPEAVKKGQFSVEVKSGDKQLFRYEAPVELGAYAQMLAPVTPPDPTKFAFETQFNPVRSWLLVKGDTYYLDDPAQAKALSYRVLPEGGGAKPVAEGRITQVAEYYLQGMLQLPPLTPGKYRVEATMELADGTKLGPMTGGFEKKDEAKEFARWWGKKHGDVERVLPPYTALTCQENAVKCLGREYALDSLGLPAAVRSAGEAVLAAPARIVVTAGGKETVIPVGKSKITEQKDWRVRFEGSAEGAGLKFSAAGWLEQDGLVYLDLTYAPAGQAPVKVEALRIEYPLADTDADGLLCIGPGENFSSRTTMLLPDNKTGRLWSTLETGITGSGMTVGSFYPTVWIGSERRGFLWWADNDKGWVQDNAVPAHEAVRKDGAVVFINHIVAIPTELKGPRTLALSYMATPFKPLVKGWRTTQATEDGTFFTPFRGVRKDSKSGEKVYQNPGGGLKHVNWIHPESRYPEEWESLWAEQKKAADAHARGQQWRDPYAARSGVNFTHMSFQIYGYGRKTLEDHLYAYFGNEWEPDTWNETYTDYAMSLFEPAFTRGGVRSTYWDLTFPILFKDLLSGLAYQLPDGRVQRGYNGWNLRRFFMRLHALQYDAGLVPGANGFHSSNAYVPVAMPWVDSVLDGERNWAIDSSPLDWVDNMPIERMRSMSVSESWGVPICWMANMDSKDEAKRDAAKRVQAQWVWLHDSWLNPYIPQLPRMPDSVLDWGVNDERTAYHPYWRNPFVTCADAAIQVGLWQLPDRVLLLVQNRDEKAAKDAVLKLDLAVLGVEQKLIWQEFVGVRQLHAEDKAPGPEFDYDGRTLTLKGLPAQGSRLVVVRRY